MGVDTYYMNPAHVGENPDIPRHLMAHYGVIPIALVMATVIGGVVYGIAWAVRRWSRKRQMASA